MTHVYIPLLRAQPRGKVVRSYKHWPGAMRATLVAERIESIGAHTEPVGPVGTRVPMDLSVIGPVRMGMRISLSPRRERLGRTRGKDSRAAKYRESPGEASQAALLWGGASLFREVNPCSSRGPPGLLRVASVQSKASRAHMAMTVATE